MVESPFLPISGNLCSVLSSDMLKSCDYIVYIRNPNSEFLSSFHPMFDARGVLMNRQYNPFFFNLIRKYECGPVGILQVKFRSTDFR